METLSICVRLCEQGINPEALSSVIKELRKATEALKVERFVCQLTLNKDAFVQKMINDEVKCKALNVIKLASVVLRRNSEDQELGSMCSNHKICYSLDHVIFSGPDKSPIVFRIFLILWVKLYLPPKRYAWVQCL